MTTQKEQLKLHYEQQKTFVHQIIAMRKELQTEQKLTTNFRKQRDRYKAERQTLLTKVTPDLETRESRQEYLEKLEKRKNFLKRQAQRSEGPIFKILSQPELESLTMVESKYHLYELEFKQQTTSLSREDEDVLVEEIKRVEDHIALLEKRNEVIVADYLGDVPETKEKITQEISEIEVKISQEEAERREVNEKLQQMYSRINPLKEEEDKSHQEFVIHLQRIDELKVQIQAKQEELDSLKGKIVKLKKKIAEETHNKVYGEIEEKIQELLKKRDKGESLSPEEQEFLMGYGHVPF
ncbi:MAG: hypothetical protein ACXAC8_14055 [Candidatus Hodarchaeales archaeon]